MAHRHYWVLQNGSIKDVSNLTYTHIEFASKYFEIDLKDNPYYYALMHGWIRIMTTEPNEFDIAFHKNDVSRDAAARVSEMIQKRQSNLTNIHIEFTDKKKYLSFGKNEINDAIDIMELIAQGKKNKIREMKLTNL